jgi:hypothetical protein
MEDGGEEGGVKRQGRKARVVGRKGKATPLLLLCSAALLSVSQCQDWAPPGRGTGCFRCGWDPQAAAMGYGPWAAAAACFFSFSCCFFFFFVCLDHEQ